MLPNDNKNGFDPEKAIENRRDRLDTLDVKGGRTRTFVWTGFRIKEAVAHFPESSREGHKEMAVVWVREPFRSRKIGGVLNTRVSQSLFYPEKDADSDFIEHLIDQTRRNVAVAFLKYWNPEKGV